MTSPVLLVAFAVGAPALKDKAPAAPTIEGEWKVERRHDSGKPSTDNNIWIFSPGGVAEIREPVGFNVASNLTYTLASDGAVKTIDFMEGQGNGKADLRQGIYKIEGDTLTVSFTLGNSPRPTSFDPSPDYYVIALKRVKK
jgi:uncharacterized protein (TIGR03067 family)